MKKIVFVFSIFIFIAFSLSFNLPDAFAAVTPASLTGAKAGASKTFGKGTSVSEDIGEYVQAVETTVNTGKGNVTNLAGKDVLDATEQGWYVKLAGLNEDTLSMFPTEQRQALIDKYGNGVINDISAGIAYTFNPPASTQTYVADLLDSAKIIPAAQAQGLGFSSLNPILEAWKVFRNVAYLFFVIIFLVIGFMIMFRQKIGGQAAITAQQAIPSIIIALLAVTFSYAIAGLMIDLMYVLMYLLIGLFSHVDGIDATVLNKNFIEVGWDLVTNSNDGAWGTVGDVVENFVTNVVNFNGIGGEISTWISSVTLGLILAIAILFGVFKLFFELVKTYAMLIATIVFAPLTLMFGAIPGNNSFSQWLKNVFGNLFAFPVVLLILIFYKMMAQTEISAGGFVPPFMLGGSAVSMILPIVGLGMILVMPDIVEKVKTAVGVTNPFEDLVKGAIGQFREAAPIGAKTAGAGFGALGGTAFGLGKGLWDTREQSGLRRVWNVGVNTLRGTGNTMAAGSKMGGRFSSAVGGQTPSKLAFAEEFVDKGSAHFSDDERLKRISERKNWYGRDRAADRDYSRRREMAEQQAAKKEWEEDRLRQGQFGTAIDNT